MLLGQSSFLPLPVNLLRTPGAEASQAPSSHAPRRPLAPTEDFSLLHKAFPSGALTVLQSGLYGLRR